MRSLIIIFFGSLIYCSASEPQTLKSMFKLMPHTIFNNTTEGISAQEKNKLITNLESEFWKITNLELNKLSIRCKKPNSSIEFYSYPFREGSVILVNIFNEKTVTMEAYVFNSVDKTVSRQDRLIPNISINDFLTGDKKLSISNKQVICTVDSKTGILKFTPVTWMDDNFKERKYLYCINARWDGTEFKISKSLKKE